MGLSNARRALVVDSNPWNRRQICDVLAKKGYEVSACDSLREARDFYRSHPVVVAGETDGDGDLEAFVSYVRETVGEGGGYVIRLAVDGDDENGAIEVDDVIGPDLELEVLEAKLQKADEWLDQRALAEEGAGSGKARTADSGADVEIISSGPAATDNDLKTKENNEAVKMEIEIESGSETGEDDGIGEAISSEMLSEDSEPSVSIRRGKALGRPAPAAADKRIKGASMPEKTTKYQYDLLIENAPLAMAMFDGDMRYLIANGLWRQHFDLEDAKVIGRGHFDIFSEVSDRWQTLLDRARSENREVVGEEFVEWPDGTTDWVRWTMRPWEDKSGEAGGLVISCGVISEEKAKRGEQAFESGLAESLMSSGVTPVVILDFSGRVLRCNRIAKRWGDWGDASGDDRLFWDAFVPVEARQAVHEEFHSHAVAMDEDGEFNFPPVSVEAVRTEDGGERFVAWTNTPRVGDDGVITGLVRVGVEIKQDQMPTVEVPSGDVDEETVSELQDEWMDSFPLMCWRTNSRGKIRFFNRQWLDFRGRNSLEECDNGWMDGLHEEDYDSLIHAFDTAAKTGARVNHVARMLGGDGQYRWMRFVSARDFSDLEGVSDGFIGYCEDLGRIIRLENELSAARSRYDELLEDSTGAFRSKRALEQQIVELNEKIASEAARLDGEREAAVAQLTEELARVRVQAEEAVGVVRAELAEVQAERDAVRAEAEAERARLLIQHDQVRAEAEAEQARLLSQHNQVLAEAGAEKARLFSQHDQVRAEAEAEKARLSSEHDEAIAAIEKTKLDLAAEHGRERDEALARLAEKKDAQLQRSLADKEVALGRVLEEKQAALEERESVVVGKLAATEAELEGLRDRSRGDLESLRSELKARISELEVERDDKVAEHVQGFAALKADFDSAVAEKVKLAAAVAGGQQRQESSDAELVKLRKDIDRAHKEVSAAATERDRFVLIPENAPFGMVLIARDGVILYSNKAAAEIAGVDFGQFETVEGWLREQAPTDEEEGRERLVAMWREGVWRKEGTKVLSMQTDKGLRELELKSKLLPDGQLLLSMFDVTDSLRAEEALRASEVKFRSIFYDSGVGMTLVDKTGNIFDANPAQEKLMGYSRSELRKMHIEDCLSIEEIARTQELSRQMAQTRSRSGELTIKLQPKDKRPAWAHLNISLVRDPDGEVIFAAYFFHDITKERQAIFNEERANSNLASSQAEKLAIVEASPDLILVVGPDGVVANVVPPVHFPLHVDQAMEGRPVGDVIPPIAGDYPQLALQARKFGGVVTKEFSVEQGEETFYFESRIAMSGAENLVVIVRDITAAKKAELVMHRQALTFANIRDAIVVADLKGRIKDWNPAAEQLFGYSHEEALGMGLYEIYDRDEPKRFKQTITAAIGKDRKWEARTQFHCKDGSVGECEVRYTPLLDESGRPLALVGVTRLAGSGAGEAAPQPALIQAAPITGLDPRIAHQQLKDSVQSFVDVLAAQEASATLDEDLRVELGINRARLEAVAILLRVIEEGGDYEHVDFGKYVGELVRFLLAEFGPEHAGIEVHLNVKGITLPAYAAQPLAMVLFELLSNSLRHAFIRRSGGMVGVSMGVGAEAGWMVVNDDGTGLPTGFNLSAPPHGAGLRIAAQQVAKLNGELKLADAMDTEIQVGFRLNGAT